MNPKINSSIRTVIPVVIIVVVSMSVMTDCAQTFPPYQLVFGWKEMDFKFESQTVRQQKIKNKEFIPRNNVVTGIKVSNNRIFLTVPRIYPGVPATLSYVDYNPNLINNNIKSPPLIPYPDWALQEIGNCSALQFTQSMEIDPFNRMWIIDIDTGRVNIRTDSPINKCQPKLVIMDLKTNQIIQTYLFPPEVVSMEMNYLNDIVVGCKKTRRMDCWAYITDDADPKLVVYHLKTNKSWAVRHSSMRLDPAARTFTILGRSYILESPLNGIALGPVDRNFDTLYYSPLTSYNIFSVSTKILQNISLVKHGEFKLKDSDVTLFGTKSSQSASLGVDSEGVLYYGMLSQNRVNYWNTSDGKLGKWDGEVLARNDVDIQFPDTLGFGHNGYLYATTNRLPKFLNKELNPKEVNFRVVRMFTGTKSYMYSPKDFHFPHSAIEDKLDNFPFPPLPT